VDFSQRIARIEVENHDLRTRVNSLEDMIKHIQEAFLKRAEDQAKVEGNVGTEASKKRSRVVIGQSANRDEET
jgi:hypothetical protein